MEWDISVRDIGPYFFDDETGSAVTVTSERYVLMVNEFFFQELRCRDIDLAATSWTNSTYRSAVDEHLKILPPSGCNQLDQQHIPLGSGRTP